MTVSWILKTDSSYVFLSVCRGSLEHLLDCTRCGLIKIYLFFSLALLKGRTCHFLNFKRRNFLKSQVFYKWICCQIYILLDIYEIINSQSMSVTVSKYKHAHPILWNGCLPTPLQVVFILYLRCFQFVFFSIDRFFRWFFRYFVAHNARGTLDRWLFTSEFLK